MGLRGGVFWQRGPMTLFISMGAYVYCDPVYFHLEIVSQVYTWGLFVSGALARWPSCLPSSLGPTHPHSPSTQLPQLPLF